MSEQPIDLNLSNAQAALANLAKACTASNPEHKIGDALVGIGCAILHLADTIERRIT